MENRAYPRVNASFPIKIDSNILGEVVDISQTGLGLVFEKPLSLSKVTAEIELSPKESIKTEFKVIWNKQLVQKGKFRYGACFIRLKEKERDLLREIYIRKAIERVVGNIPVFETKQRVIDFFVVYCKKFMSQLDSLACSIRDNNILLDHACKKSENLNDDIVKKGHEIENLLNSKPLAKKLKECFRTLLGPWGYKGKILKRAFEKPRGYPGDYLTIEFIYDNKAISEGIGYCSDTYFLNNKYAVAVRNRKDKMKDILNKHLISGQPGAIKILNIACGSCREIVDVLCTGSVPKKEMIFTLVDHDQEALDFSRNALASYESKDLKFNYLNHNVLDYIKNDQEYKKILGNYSLIYSIGLADYIPDKILKRLISFWFSILQPWGSLVLAHKDMTQYDPIPIDWWANWTFYPRNEKNILDIVHNSIAESFDLKIERDKSNIILFFNITKK